MLPAGDGRAEPARVGHAAGSAAGPTRSSASIGRSLRGVVDLAKLGERTITVDCDVLQADGGTRTASITGGYVALAAALISYGMERYLVGKVAAVSVGIVDGQALLDLDYCGGLARRGRLQRRRHRRRHVRRAAGHGRGQAVRPGGDEPACSTWPAAGLRAALRRAGGGASRPSAAEVAEPGAADRRRDPVGPQAARAAGAAPPDRARAGRPRRRRRPPTTVEETGTTFEANARLKARAYARLTGLPTLADDSGIEVDALDGAPGVRTRRYAGEHATDGREQRQAARRRSAACRAERRGARYVCVLALVDRRCGARTRGTSPVVRARGTCRGRIALAPRGTGGFGYDPIFEPAARAARWPDPRPVVGGGEERDLASRPRRAADGAPARGPRDLRASGWPRPLRTWRRRAIRSVLPAVARRRGHDAGGRRYVAWPVLAFGDR